MISDLSKAYELLGVKPGVSIRELKAAHRDLAKVWHPDRFLHDPRLQEKAQEKLKEINEAYEIISSGKVPRSAPTPTAQTVYASERQPSRRSGSGRFMWVPIILFAAVFVLTTKYLLEQRSQPVAEVQTETEQVEPAAETRPDSNLRSETNRKTNRDSGEAEQPATTESPISLPNLGLETVTVTVDPASGLLARSDCPVRSRMTYPRGREPSAHCNITHAPPEKKSRLESITDKLLPQKRKGAEATPTN